MNEVFGELLIHIGYHKTASSWLQQRIFTSKSKYFEPLSRRAKGPSTVARKFIYNDDKYMLSPFDFNEEEIKKEVTDILSKRRKSKIYVISNERLSGNPQSSGYDAEKIAYMLKRNFPTGKVLIIIREQKSFLYSIYFQYISNGGTMSLENYLNTKYDGKRPFFSPSYIDYLPLVSKYYSLYGEEKVLVLPYELFKSDPAMFFAKLGGFLNIKLDIDEKEYDVNINENISISSRYYFRFLNIFLKSNSVNNYSIYSNKFTEFFSKKTLNILEVIMPSWIDSYLEKKLKKTILNFSNKRYTESNLKLSKLINLQLSKYNYE